MTFGSFGDIVFEVPVAPSSADYSRSVNYAEHDVIGGAPVLEQTGRAADQVNLEIILKAELDINVQQEIQRFRDATDSDPRRLTIGTQILGLYVLEEVGTTYNRVVKDVVEQATLSLSLKEYN